MLHQSMKTPKCGNEIGGGMKRTEFLSVLPDFKRKRSGYKRSIELSKEYGLANRITVAVCCKKTRNTAFTNRIKFGKLCLAV